MTPQSRRRWFRLSLRSLLVRVVTITSCEFYSPSDCHARMCHNTSDSQPRTLETVTALVLGAVCALLAIARFPDPPATLMFSFFAAAFLVTVWQSLHARRIAFSLRSMFAMITLLCGVLGWLAIQAKTVANREAVLQWAMANGAVCEHFDPPGTGVKSMVQSGLLGDRPLRSIILLENFPLAEIPKVRSAFPEARIYVVANEWAEYPR